MSEFISITIDDSRLQAALQRLERACVHLAPAMRKITGTMANIVEENFEAEGRPRWKPLAEATKFQRLGGKKAYKKDGQLKASAQRKLDAGFRILQHRGQLAASVVTDHNDAVAVIGSNLAYARIHQLGGMAGRGRKVEIAARPYLPINTDGKLQPEAREAVLDTVLRYLETTAGM